MRNAFAGLVAVATLAASLGGCSSADSSAQSDAPQRTHTPATEPFVEIPRPTTESAAVENAAMKLGEGWSCASRDVESVQYTYGLRPDLLGLTSADVRQEAREQQNRLRVLGENGDCADRTLDLRDDRVNVYLRDERVVWAAIF